MLKTVVLMNIAVEKFIFQDSHMNRKFKSFEIEIFCNIINVFTFTFDQFNASLMDKNVFLLCFSFLFFF